MLSYRVPLQDRLLNTEAKWVELIDAIRELSEEISQITVKNGFLIIAAGNKIPDLEKKVNQVQSLFVTLLDYPKDILFERKSKYSMNPKNPMPDLLNRGLLFEVGEGIYCYKELLADLYAFVDKKFEAIAQQNGARRVVLPSLLSPDILLQSNYLSSHEDSCEYVFEASHNAEYNTNKPFSFVLTPAVCQGLYPSFANMVIEEKIFTGYSKCFRNETNYSDDLTRLREYGIREIVYIGSENSTLQFRDLLINELIKQLKYFDLSGKVESASDAFFSNNSLSRKIFQLALRMKYEVNLEIPYLNKYIAVSSVNYHGDFFGQRWNIRTCEGSFAHSCCCGIGLDRWIYALISQRGTDISAYRDLLGL